MRLQPGLVRHAHHLDHLAVGHALVGAQLDSVSGFCLAASASCARQLLRVDRLVVQEGLAALVEHHGDEARASAAGGLGLGQVQPHGAGQQRRRDDEDHHQHQHHVDQRRDVDVAHGRGPSVRSRRPKAMSA
jgi:hypothetical protein